MPRKRRRFSAEFKARVAIEAIKGQRTLAQLTEITFSNSLIESWWRAIKHQWLYLNTLDTVKTLEKLVAFYVDEHNTRLARANLKWRELAHETPECHGG